jgi:thymidylate synthase (FAD)
MTAKVYVLARPEFGTAYQDFLQEFLPADQQQWRERDDATAAERLVEFAGRVCYMSFGSRQSPGTNAEYIRKLIHNGHESVLEHASWTVLVSGVSRAFTHQLVRHRAGFSFSQLSQQYHDESEARFVRPAGLDQDPELAKVWDQAMSEAQHTYRRILTGLTAPTERPLSAARREKLRAMRSTARSVLPNATETVIAVTANARAFRNLLKSRGNIVGDAEMRCFSAALLEALRPEAPSLFFDFSIQSAPDGLPLVIHGANGTSSTATLVRAESLHSGVRSGSRME